MGLTLNQYLNEDRKSDIIKFFKDIHTEIENRYKPKLGNQKAEAQTLQLFFKKVQYIQNKLLNTKVTTQAGRTVGWGSTAIIDKTSGIKANEQIIKEISEKFNDKFLVRVAAEALGKKSTKNIFARAANEKSDNLERPIANLALSLYQNALGSSLSGIGKSKKKQIANIQVGSKTTNLQSVEGIGKEVRDLPDEMFQIFTQKVKTDANKMFQALRNDPLEQNFVYTNNYGKVDITGLNLNINFNLIAGAGPFTKKALNIINKSKLSLKNYRTKWDIHLGDTDAWKAFSVPLLALNKNTKDILDAFIAPDLEQFSENKQTLNAHINHVRFVYELSGLGQETEADFILINKPNTDEIYVFAVSELILKQMAIETSVKQLRSFSIPQSSFRKT